MKISLRIHLFVAVSVILFLISAGAGYTGIQRLSSILDLVSGPAWNAADGAMEGTIGTQQQMLAVNQMVHRGEGAHAAAGHADGAMEMMKEGIEMAEEAFGRMAGSGLIPDNQVKQLDNLRGTYGAARDQVLQAMRSGASDNIEALMVAYDSRAQELLSFTGELEEFADGRVEGETENIATIKNTATMTLLATVLIGALILGAAAWYGQMKISAPLSQLADRLRKLAAELAEGRGDLTMRFEVSGKDELAELAAGSNTLVEQLGVIVKRVSDASNALAGAAANLSAVAEENNQGTMSQQHEMDQVATAMNEMTASSQEVANSAAHAAQASTEADHNTRIGGQVIEAAVSSIEGLAQEVATAAEAIQRVEGDSNNIGAILDVIRGIADQTNLLALNAAIEAARAGEQGRGFAVVADEVRTLAMRTQESTQEIQAMIETLQQGTGVAVKAMESSHQRSAETVEQASKAGETFESIARAVGTISDMNTQIASAAEEQTAVTEDISRSLSGINDVLARSVHGATEAAASSEQVAGLAGDMQAITRNFQV